MQQDPDHDFETEDHPMSEALFNQFSMVRGFNTMNGATYTEYCANWEKRRLSSSEAPAEAKPDVDASVPINDKLRPSST